MTEKLGQYLLAANTNTNTHTHTHSHIHFRTFNVLSGFTNCLLVIFALGLLVDVFLHYDMNNVLCFFFFSLFYGQFMIVDANLPVLVT